MEKIVETYHYSNEGQKIGMAEKQALDVLLARNMFPSDPNFWKEYPELSKRFYEENTKIESSLQKTPQTAPKSNPQEQKKPSAQIGVLWTQKNNEIKGKLNDKRIVIPQSIAEMLLQLGEGKPFHYTLKEGQEITIFKNKFKKSATQPDFVILEKK